MKVAVIGSGLSAIGAIRALVKEGIKPVVLDVGEELDEKRNYFVQSLAKKSPEKWTAQERLRLSHNKTLTDGSSIPKKLIFGSDYFYGKSNAKAPIKVDGNMPPFSYALGGLSVGWGAAVLPPQRCDLDGWPVPVDELYKYIEMQLQFLPYSACSDELNLNFPLLSSQAMPLTLSKVDRRLLNKLRATSSAEKDKLLYGQARLLVASPESNGDDSCRSCGQCMSGCVYKSIYKANDEIKRLAVENKILYRPGHLVNKLSEENGLVSVMMTRTEEGPVSEEFDKVFLAAGAVNSTRIVLASRKLTDKKVNLKTRGGFVLPIFSFRKLKSEWPNCNTQPGLFIELKGKRAPHWTHIQLSTANELLIQKLNIGLNANGFLVKIKRFISSHLILALVNYHSDHSGDYKLWISKESTSGINSEKNIVFNSKHNKKLPQFPVLIETCFKIAKLFLKIGAVPLFPLARMNSGSYHVGGSFPMSSNPSGKFETDTLGRLSNWNSIHVIDTSVFPTLPGTTIGLLAMGNAYRIAELSIREGMEENNDKV